MSNDRPVLPWMPWFVEEVQSSPRYRAMKDYQQAWYRNLLDNEWLNSDNPGYLPNDPDRLWRLANARTKWFFERENTVVMACFQGSADGRWLSNSRLLQVYEEQLKKFKAKQKPPRESASNSKSVLVVESQNQETTSVSICAKCGDRGVYETLASSEKFPNQKVVKWVTCDCELQNRRKLLEEQKKQVLQAKASAT